MTIHLNNNSFLSTPLGTILGTILVLLCCPMARADSPKVTRFSLDNGIRVVILYVEGSGHIAIFTYLPLGLAADGKARTQWSHLVEHLTLAATGPITDFKERNAETMPHGMHLDFMGKADRWKEGLELQSRWLSGLPFSEPACRAEVRKALSEIDTTSANLFTHKWAIAAWNQAFRHGQTKVAVRGAVQSARWRQLQAYRDRYLVQPKRTMLCVIGGIAPQTLKPEIQKRFGSIASAGATLPKASTTRASKAELTATWDLNVSHYIETYALPKPDHEDYPALYVAAMLLNQSLFTDQTVKQWAGMVLCGVDLITPEGAYLYVSASLKPGADSAKARAYIEQQVDQLRKAEHNAQAAMAAAMLSAQMRAPTDIALAMKFKPARITEDIITANVGLQWGLLEFQYGDTLSRVAGGLSKVSAADVALVATKYLSKAERNTLLLNPGP
jgi:predicted Zn-dependent peptidase